MKKNANVPSAVKRWRSSDELSEEERKCPECGEEMEVIGKKVTKHLEIIPAQVRIREDVYFTYACRKCHENEADTPVVETPQPNPVIKGSFASAQAIAHLMTQKFVMHSPLYRQEQELKQKGIELSRQTMSNWFITASKLWLEPLYEKMKELLLKESILHADETTLQVLKTKDKPTATKSYMWLYRTSGCCETPIVLYDYRPNRKAENPESFLKEFKGYLHTDGYKAYRGIENVTIVGCIQMATRHTAGLKMLRSSAVGRMPEEDSARRWRFCRKHNARVRRQLSVWITAVSCMRLKRK